MSDDLISREVVLDYLGEEKDKLIESKHKDIIPPDARKGALLSIKSMMCFITQLKG